jgi:hypothetical protein
MAQLKPLLARNGVGVIVIGNSIIQGIDIRTESILGELGAMHGLKLEGIHCIREKREGRALPNRPFVKGNVAKQFFLNLSSWSRNARKSPLKKSEGIESADDEAKSVGVKSPENTMKG